MSEFEHPGPRVITLPSGYYGLVVDGLLLARYETEAEAQAVADHLAAEGGGR